MHLLFYALLIWTFNCFAIGQAPFAVSHRDPHQLTILNHGLGSLEARLQMIERAEKTIDMEYFIYHLDTAGKIFTRALLKAAKEKRVKIRILLDHLMTKKEFSPFLGHELAEAGIEVKYYNLHHPFKSYQGQFRNHRKFLVVDGKEVITGGRNIGDEYVEMDEVINFLDRDILIKGPIVKQIQETFDEFWYSPLSQSIKREKRPKKDKKWQNKVARAKSFISTDHPSEAAIRSLAKAELEREFTGTCEDITFISERPIASKERKSTGAINSYINGKIRGTQNNILIETPYFITNEESKIALHETLGRDVKITLMTNSMFSTDAFLVYAVYDSKVKGWIEKGMENYTFKGHLIDDYPIFSSEVTKTRFGVHGKAIIFDDVDVMIGTFNMDPRSALFNAEAVITCEGSHDIADAVKKDIKRHIDKSYVLDSKKTIREAEFPNIKLSRKIFYYLFKFPANWLSQLL